MEGRRPRIHHCWRGARRPRRAKAHRAPRPPKQKRKTSAKSRRLPWRTREAQNQIEAQRSGFDLERRSSGRRTGRPAFRPAARLRRTSVLPEAKPRRRGNSLPPSMCSAEGWSRPLGGGTQKERHLLSQMSFFWGTAQQYRCATDRFAPKTKSKPSEAGSIWKGGAAAGELADRPSGRRRVCAVQAFCAAGAKPWRRRNSLPPSMCSAEGWSRPLGGGTQKERHLLSQMSFFLVRLKGLEPPAFRTGI